MGVLGTVMMLCGCAGTAPTKEMQLADSLNRQAYTWRYKSLDSSLHSAMLVLREVQLYDKGRAEAVNNLGFDAFMRMDFEQAERYHKEVRELTKNELELLIADVELMKIYQRTAMNKEFYDYRNSALRRLKRIHEDSKLFVGKHERSRLHYARSEFFIVSAIYYYYLQQRSEALDAIRSIQAEALPLDTNQLLYYHYIRAATSLCEEESAEELVLAEFDELYFVWKHAKKGGYLYFEGNALQGMANLLVVPANYDLLLHCREYALQQMELPLDSLLPRRLGEQALACFTAYKDVYQIAGTYVTIAKYLNAHGQYSEALDTLVKALNCVNSHHYRHYGVPGKQQILKPFEEKEYASVEKDWMRQGDKTVPEWISRIREQLSLAYAGLGEKRKSDYNRNVYLDILEDTRQDKELESRYQALRQMSRQQNMLLLAILAGSLLVTIGLFVFNRRSKLRNGRYLLKLKQVMEITRKITASIPADAHSEEEISNAIIVAISDDMKELFGTDEITIERGELLLSKRLNREDRAMMRIIAPYVSWALNNGMTTASLANERLRIEKQRYVYEQHIVENKQENILKKTCVAIVNGIQPYIDRILHEVQNLRKPNVFADSGIRAEKYQYINELITQINEYNDIISLWIQVKQGKLSLHIETFELNELFDLIRKGSRAFEMKSLQLEVQPTEATVKADKALTLFMINTLAENARKYTPPGSTVRVYAESKPDYVEISVEDNGYGLSPEDVARIVNEKLYDSREIGMKNAFAQKELLKNKGSGFGLMNCKGIIEKYRKTNSVFEVCTFSVESTPGSGCRFYFRLPPGIRRALMSLFFCCVGSNLLAFDTTAVRSDVSSASFSLLVEDSIGIAQRKEYERLLNIASDYANDAYYCNIEGKHEAALQYIDSAMSYLNMHHEQYAKVPYPRMTLFNEGKEPAELTWLGRSFNSDYHVILDIRNEAAVAFLALKEWEAYAYNNSAYTTLYKLLSEDRSLEEYCRRLEYSTGNKRVGIMLFAVLIMALGIGYYILYVRKRLVNRWNLEHVLEINKLIFKAASTYTTRQEASVEEYNLLDIPRRIVNEAYESMDELLRLESLGIAVYNDSTHRLEYSLRCSNEAVPIPDAGITAAPETSYRELVETIFEEGEMRADEKWVAFPLKVTAVQESRCIGVLFLEYKEDVNKTGREANELLIELITRYVALVVLNAVVKLANRYQDIETAREEARRAYREESVLHVQNMVLDNCLSTIKHETIYYPNKIKQLTDKMLSGGCSAKEEHQTIESIEELIAYYKGVFTILSRCASRQLEEVTFRRRTIEVNELLDWAVKYFKKAARHTSAAVSFSVKKVDVRITGDIVLLRFLLENLINEALRANVEGEILLEAFSDKGYVHFRFTDSRREKTKKELNELFYPDLLRMTAFADKGQLNGVEYLVAKQVIREHDEFAGLRGCRINAEQADGGGFSVYFTIPEKQAGTES